MATSTSPNPRWKKLIAESIKNGIGKDKSILYYSLSTVSPGPPPRPHVRTVVHRGFVNEQRNKDSESGVAPFDSNFGSNTCLLTTTDIRAGKAKELLETIKSKNNTQEGAETEIAWWMESAQLQFRITGQMYLLPTQSHESFSLFPTSKSSLQPPSASSSSNSSSSSSTFDWVQERQRIFNKLSPGLLASFCRPVPGSDHPNSEKFKDFGKGNLDGAGEGKEGVKDDLNSPWPLELPQPGKEENQKQKDWLKVAEKNFGLLVVEPYQVDVVDLERDQRSLFELDSKTNEWTEKRLVP